MTFDPATLLKFVDLRKLPAWVWLVGFLVACAVLLAPQHLLEVAGLADVRTAHRGWLGVGVLLSGAALLSHGFVAALTRVSVILAARQQRRDQVAVLTRLSPPEKAILREYIEKRTKTQYFTASNGVIAGLEHSQLVYRATMLSTHGQLFAFNIQPWAWEFLLANESMLAETAPADTERLLQDGRNPP